MELWAFGVSKDGLAMEEDRFWALTPTEFGALTHRYMMARGIKPEPTVEDQLLRREFDVRMNRARCESMERRKAERNKKRNHAG